MTKSCESSWAARGFTLVELATVVLIILVVLAVAAPALRAYSVEAHLLGAGRVFRVEFLKARSMAVRGGVYTAIRFERAGDRMFYSVYADGNRNGVRSAEILTGVDVRVAGPFALHGNAPGVRVGMNPGVPEIPPDSGFLTGDPIRFGSSDILSFSPLGTATPGTFYLAGEGVQAAVRVVPATARVRLLTCRGGRWRER
jgi:prepilin-type N-terminal cleavage/methylation domain-containing protein